LDRFTPTEDACDVSYTIDSSKALLDLFGKLDRVVDG
jgi:hypothetical protein